MALIVYDKNRKALGDLQLASKVTETQKINEAYLFSFSLPRDDAKNELCQPLHYVRYNNGHLYRILPSQDDLTETGMRTYQCEHVIMTLVDTLLMGYHKIGNRGTYTEEVINWILDKQNKTFNLITKKWELDADKKANWILGSCAFRREFEYAWTNSSLLDALFGVPAPIPDKYMWTYNTNTYPWTLNLTLIDQTINPQFYISAGKNLVKLTKVSDPTKLCTRILPLGQGEGDSQLNIAPINGGIPYIQSDAEHIAKYGVIEKLFEDQRYTVPENLLDTAKSLLAELQDPYQQYQVEFASLDKGYYDTPEIGKIVEITGFVKTYIVGIAFDHDEIPKSQLEIANKPQDVAVNFADMTQRAQIDAAYGQGYTSFLPSHEYGNATPSAPLALYFTIPGAITDVERVVIDVGMSPFRFPFGVKAVDGEDTTTGQSKTITGEPSTPKTSEDGTQDTGLSGGGYTEDGGERYTEYNDNEYTELGGGEDTYLGGTDSTDDSYVDIGSVINGSVEETTFPFTGTTGEGLATNGHKHLYNMTFHHTERTTAHNHMTSNHSHTMEYHIHQTVAHEHIVPGHSHEMELHKHQTKDHFHTGPLHSHDMLHNHDYAHEHNIKQHEHELTAQVTYAGNPTAFTVRINSIDRQVTIGTDAQIDIKPWLLNAQNDVPRNIRHVIEIVPDDPAYIMLSLDIQGFANTKGEANA